MAKQATAEVQPDGKYLVKHADGTEELLTEGQFKAQYELEDEDPKVKGDEAEPAGTSTEETPEPKGDKPSVPDAVQGTQGPLATIITSDIDGGQIGTQGGDEDPPTLSKQHRPETHDADDAFVEDEGEFHDEYFAQVNEELKALEENIKEVRAQLKSADKAKPEDRDYGALRSAIHDLSHGKSLLRTAHAVTVRHDGPERLRPAPTTEDTMSSGPGEELNYAEVGTEGRKVGR